MNIISDSKINPLSALIHTVALLMLAMEHSPTNNIWEFPQTDVHGPPLIRLKPSSVPVATEFTGGGQGSG